MLVGAKALAADGARDARVALRGSGQTLSYAELRDQAARIARHSATWSAHDDDRSPFVGVLCDWTPRFVGSFLGLASAGWAVGVLDPTWSPDELAGAIAQLNPAAVLVGDACRAAAAPLRTDGWRVAGHLDPDWTVLTCSDARTRRAAADPTADAPFYVGFTSGSSGRPKAFLRSHRSWWESFERFSELCPVDTDRAVLVPGPLSSSHFLFGVLHALHVGATAELLPSGEYSPERVTALAERAGRLAALYVVPTMLAQLANGASARSTVVPDYIFCAGARLDGAVRALARERFPASRLVEYYGASELSFVAIDTDGAGTPPGSVGRVFPGVEVTIRDDDDAILAPGETGVIFARSPLTFMGYRGQPPESGARALDGGWLTVGDRGALDEAGFLSVVGRGSSLIITGGANVQPEEVEEMVTACPGIAACCVVGLPHPIWGEVVCAVVVVDAGADLRRADLRRHAARTLSRYKRPRRYVALDGPLPVGRSGKVDRSKVRQLVLDGRSVRELR